MAKLKPNQFEILPGVVISEIPLLFQTDMVKAVLADRKTQTRRTVKDPGITYDLLDPTLEDFLHITSIKSRYGKPGDLLWVRESHCKIELRNYYKSDGAFDEILETYDLDKIRWKPSIHMPKSTARIWLMVEEIRAERVQEISNEDAIQEGIEQISTYQGFGIYKNYLRPSSIGANEFFSFFSLWSSINGEESWNQNPWVWVVKFRVLSKTGRPNQELILQNFKEVTANRQLPTEKQPADV